MVQEGMHTLGCGTDSPRDGNCALGSAISEGKRSCPFEVLREGQGVHISRVDWKCFHWDASRLECSSSHHGVHLACK